MRSKQPAGNTSLFEFIVPMVPASWNDTDTVARYETAFDTGTVATAVAISILDVCQPADSRAPRGEETHWGLMHFLLDGHHKTHAAASKGTPLRVLSFLAIDESLATREQVLALPGLLQTERTT